MRELIPFFFAGRIAEASFVKSVKEGQIGKAYLLRRFNDAGVSVSDQGSCLMKAHGVATGSDNTDPVPPHITERRMYGGRVSVLVRLSAQGTATVYAKSFGLQGGKIYVINT